MATSFSGRGILPLPRVADWRAADGWLPVGLVLLAGGAIAVLLLCWLRLAPGTAPLPSRLLPTSAILAVAALAIGAPGALRPMGQGAVWRWMTIGAVAAGAVWSDPAGLHTRFGFGWLLAAGFLALAVRAGETLAYALAGPLQARAERNPLAAPLNTAATREVVDLVVRGKALPDANLDLTTNQSPRWTTWRLVAEFWALAALGAAAAGLPATPWRVGAAAAAAGGVLLVTGTTLAMLQASWAARRFAFAPAQGRAFWGLGLSVAGGLILLALLLPMPPGPFSAKTLAGILHGLHQARLAATPPGAAGPATTMNGPSVGGVLALPAFLVAALVHELWLFFGLWLLTPAALPLVLAAAAAAGLFLLRALRRPEFRALLHRLAGALLSAFAFWRWLRLPGRMRRTLERLGLLRRAPAQIEAAALRDRLLERLWGWVDPRAAVRLTYRRFLRAMAEAGAGRPAGASPRSFERTVRDRELAGPEVAELTAAYELARYSGHPAEPGWAERARRGWKAVSLRFRAGGGKGRRRVRRRTDDTE